MFWVAFLFVLVYFGFSKKDLECDRDKTAGLRLLSPISCQLAKRRTGPQRSGCFICAFNRLMNDSERDPWTIPMEHLSEHRIHDMQFKPLHLLHVRLFCSGWRFLVLTRRHGDV